VFLRRIASLTLASMAVTLSIVDRAHADPTNVGFVVSVYYDEQLWKAITYSSIFPLADPVRPAAIGDIHTVAKCLNGGLTGVQVTDGISVSVAPQRIDANGVVSARVVLHANHINAIRTVSTGACTEQVADADSASVDHVFLIGPEPLTVLNSGHFRAEVERVNLVIPGQPG
jgi:hypothetical protein